MSFNEPVGVTILGGFKINAIENTSVFAIGESTYQRLVSSTKNNLVTGQIYGDFDFNYLQPISSPIFDPDGQDSLVVDILPGPTGLED